MKRNILPLSQQIVDPNLGEKEQLKLVYVQNILKSFEQFQQYHNPSMLKAFVQNNRLTMKKLINQIQNIKQPALDVVTHDSRMSTQQNPLKSCGTQELQSSKLNYDFDQQLNSKLQKQYQQQMNYLNRKQFIVQKHRQTAFLNKMNDTLMEVNDEITKLNKKKQQLSKKLQGTPFYREWVVMCKQAEGAKHYNHRLKQELQKKKLQLAKLQDKN